MIEFCQIYLESSWQSVFRVCIDVFKLFTGCNLEALKVFVQELKEKYKID